MHDYLAFEDRRLRRVGGDLRDGVQRIPDLGDFDDHQGLDDLVADDPDKHGYPRTGDRCGSISTSQRMKLAP